MFDLAAFDKNWARHQATSVPSLSYRLQAFAAKGMTPHKHLMHNNGVRNGAMIAGFVAAAMIVFALIPPLSASAEEEMTYRGMNLEQFAEFMDIPPTDPYVIALFEELCMTV